VEVQIHPFLNLVLGGGDWSTSATIPLYLRKRTPVIMTQTAGWILGKRFLEMVTFEKCRYLREWSTMDVVACSFLVDFKQDKDFSTMDVVACSFLVDFKQDKDFSTMDVVA